MPGVIRRIRLSSTAHCILLSMCRFLGLQVKAESAARQAAMRPLPWLRRRPGGAAVRRGAPHVAPCPRLRKPNHAASAHARLHFQAASATTHTVTASEKPSASRSLARRRPWLHGAGNGLAERCDCVLSSLARPTRFPRSSRFLAAPSAKSNGSSHALQQQPPSPPRRAPPVAQPGHLALRLQRGQRLQHALPARARRVRPHGAQREELLPR